MAKKPINNDEQLEPQMQMQQEPPAAEPVAKAPPAEDPTLEQMVTGGTQVNMPGSPAAAAAPQQMPTLMPMMPPRQVINEDRVREAEETRQRYKQGKAMLEQRVIDNEQWYRLRHWECMRKQKENISEVEPTSGWLFNAIANKHADAMDNFPQPNVLPREVGDVGEAQMLSSVLPVVLDQADFEQTYDEVNDYKLKSGTGIYGVFWDSGKYNGLGDIAIKKVDIINLFWESGITDIQQSRNVFHVELVDNAQLSESYPQIKDRLGETADLSTYIHDDSIDTTDKSPVVDWYYKKNQNGRTVLHYCKYCNGVVLFATENEPEYAERGWYDHGMYPFIFDPMFRVPGSPCGFGYIDVAKSAQEYIDRGNQALLKNLLVNASPRHFIRSDGSVNEQEYADLSRDFVHVNGNLGQDSILPIQGTGLSGNYISVVANKIEELKEVTGNRDISTGGSSSGVTAASAIAAMQEAGSKLSRDANKASYRSFRKLCLMCIELIRQFYELPRCFRIIGEEGTADYIMYSNAGLVPQMQPSIAGIDAGMRVPIFDIQVTAQKASPYSKMSQNELALQFYSAGFFSPMNAPMALACLTMMDFDRKDEVIKIVKNNMMMMPPMMPIAPEQSGGGGGGSKASGGESGVTKSARERVAESTAPR